VLLRSAGFVRSCVFIAAPLGQRCMKSTVEAGGERGKEEL
jgi:hypothetical protein